MFYIGFEGSTKTNTLGTKSCSYLVYFASSKQDNIQTSNEIFKLISKPFSFDIPFRVINGWAQLLWLMVRSHL